MATIKRNVRKRALSSEGARGRSEDIDGVPTDDDLRRLVPPGLAASFLKSKLHDKSIAVAGLGEPNGWDGDMPEMPTDFATVDHDQMANMLSAFASALSTALWQASRAYIEADAYDEIAEYLEDVALLDANESNEGKRKAQARTDERVVAARAMQRTAYHNYVRFRDLAKTIEIKWRTVSRVGGFLGDEAEGETASAIKRSTRGTAAGNIPGSGRGDQRHRPRK
jgi:hypothetical protein